MAPRGPLGNNEQTTGGFGRGHADAVKDGGRQAPGDSPGLASCRPFAR